MSQCITWSHHLSDGETQTVLEALTRRLENRVKEAWVFGSYASGEATNRSDCDLILVVESELPFWQRARSFDDLWDIFPKLDVLIYTPTEWLEMQQCSSPFWRSVMTNRKQLIPT